MQQPCNLSDHAGLERRTEFLLIPRDLLFSTQMRYEVGTSESAGQPPVDAHGWLETPLAGTSRHNSSFQISRRRD
jgi:hypothetical protein